jgi:hypothetical protein
VGQQQQQQQQHCLVLQSHKWQGQLMLQHCLLPACDCPQGSLLAAAVQKTAQQVLCRLRLQERLLAGPQRVAALAQPGHQFAP